MTYLGFSCAELWPKVRLLYENPERREHLKIVQMKGNDEFYLITYNWMFQFVCDIDLHTYKQTSSFVDKGKSEDVPVWDLFS
jgi:hypothetical protein